AEVEGILIAVVGREADLAALGSAAGRVELYGERIGSSGGQAGRQAVGDAEAGRHGQPAQVQRGGAIVPHRERMAHGRASLRDAAKVGAVGSAGSRVLIEDVLA